MTEAKDAQAHQHHCTTGKACDDMATVYLERAPRQVVLVPCSRLTVVA